MSSAITSRPAGHGWRTAVATLLPVVALTILAGCASGPRVFSNEDPTANFTTFRTYGFAAPLGTDRPEYSSLTTEFLRQATSRELEARGYRRSDQPDLLVNFFVNTKEKITSSQTMSPGFGYYGYRRGYYGVWGDYDTVVTQYTEGTLTVDIVDTSRNQLVWEGTVVGRVREEDRANLRPVVDSIIAQVFEKFPYRVTTP